MRNKRMGKRRYCHTVMALQTQKLLNEKENTPGVPRSNQWYCEQWPVNGG